MREEKNRAAPLPDYRKYGGMSPDTVALRELARRIRSRKGYCCGYLSHIFTAERALAMGQYSLACHELLDVVHFYQAPEVTALIYKMLEPYFDEVTPTE